MWSECLKRSDFAILGRNDFTGCIALMVRAADSKSAGWEFESLCTRQENVLIKGNEFL